VICWCFTSHKIYHPHQIKVLQIFHAHVYSHILYMNAVYNTACGFRMTVLYRLLNKAIRAFFFEEYKHPMVHIIDLYNRHDILTLASLSELESATMVYKIKHNMMKTNIVLNVIEGFLQYGLRNNRQFCLSRIWNNYGRLGICYHGADVYKQLPLDCQNHNVLGLNDFMSRVRKFLEKKIYFRRMRKMLETSLYFGDSAS
jgi:hypothetical protein